MHYRNLTRGLALAAAIIVVGTSSSQADAQSTRQEYAEPVQVKQDEPLSLKRKIAIGRFTNETRYGQTLLRDSNLDPLGKQAADILAAYLVQSGDFLVFERGDMTQIASEQERLGGADEDMVGVDTLIIGSIVEFGRSEDGKRGLFNRERTQRAHAKVAIRLVDVRTGLAFHSATGSGEATTETKTTLGMGSTARFDGSLTDKALSVAIEDVLEELSNTIQAREWRTDILAVENGQVFVSGGPSQGLKAGARLAVMKAGRSVKSRQTGLSLQLPATAVAGLEVVSHFGSGELGEGSIARITSGSLESLDDAELYVVAK
ncbi:CsgG/HfaB family protein [Novosphingobium pentaromativorans]|uniref:Curli production assembly/transport component CsgG n=1 Tax=Novosphingobium pentaromativorans US6-1 TaxID=1088721 RepID=G6EKL0_9SPHN|nr:CsgG/HfaB family protein [Novosphingobium pentaromativorans]AIT82802.1 curli production assembly protein CsgG [Novosphingobium pentaromativorans US6-1]EHJ58166.1 Curli production assembly/transport component CsgG [Novosphingobium pentaromativorans US6-1]